MGVNDILKRAEALTKQPANEKAKEPQAPRYLDRENTDKVPRRLGAPDFLHKVTLKTVQLGPGKFQTGIHFHPQIPGVKEKEFLRGEAIDILEAISLDNGGSLFTVQPPEY